MKISIVIPAYNEQDNLRPLIEDIFSNVKVDDMEVIIVDDNSTDGTQDVCKKIIADHRRVSMIKRSKGLNGMGYALREGTSIARGKYVFWVMGDRSDDLSAIGEMMKLLDSGHDMVMASRYMQGGSRGDLEVHKAMYGSVYTKLAKVVFGIPVADITNAYRGFKKDVLNSCGIESGSFSISPEFAIKAHMRGYKLGQVPTTYHNRRAGQPNFNIVKMGVEYVMLLLLRFTYQVDKN